MTWSPISTVTSPDAPFVAWIEPYGDPADGVATIEYDCDLDAGGDVVDANGAAVANVTHWRKN